MTAAGKDLLAKKTNDTYDLVDRPKNAPVVKTRVVCTYKMDPSTGTLPDEGGHRVRWVGCGYSQIFGRNYWQTYTATTKAAGVRIISGLIARFDLDTCLIDAEKFFTQTKLQEEVFAEQMEEFVEGGRLPDGRPSKVCRLKKGLEGLKQSGNNAQINNVDHLITACQMTQLDSEPTVFKRIFEIKGAKVILLLLVWIDDILCAFTRGGYERIFLPFYKTYITKFPAKIHGAVRRFIGIDYICDKALGTLSMSQETYITNMVPKFVSVEKLKKTVTLPADRNPDKTDPYHLILEEYNANDNPELTSELYLSALASAMYASVFTRGDIAYHISFLSRFSSRPTKKAWDALERVLCYLYQTRRRCKLTYQSGRLDLPSVPSIRPPLDPTIYNQLHGLLIISDASWKTGCTYAGFIIMFAGAAADWASVQLKVMLSTAEAEIGAGALASKRAIYFRMLLGEIFSLPSTPISHIVDNSATPPLTENLGVSKKTEHFRRWLQFMRYCVLHNYTYVHLCKTDDMIADSLTKVSSLHGYSTFVKVFFNIYK